MFATSIRMIHMTRPAPISFLVLLSSSVFAQEISSEPIHWPSGYAPSESRFFVHNETHIMAPPDLVWNILIDALKWEQWYEGAHDVSFVNSSSSRLQENAAFNWQTMGLRFRSEIREFEPFRLLAWESAKKSIQGYHVWLIIPIPGGCWVITEESQNGWLTFFEKTFQKNKLHRLHDSWLEGLRKRAEHIHSELK